jgi:long-chain acyl-CoA synthetase
MQVLQEVSASNPISRAIFNMAFNGKKAALASGNASGGTLAPLWNSLVFSKVKAKLGGRVRLLTTGASPIAAEVMAFLRVCFPGATVLEGYGTLPSPTT